MNKKVLITAGPTYEPIDPVRFIGNHSSGKMGFALAEKFANEGASVILVAGPTSMVCNHPEVKTVSVVTAAEMFQACNDVFNDIDIAVFAAAVADFTPVIYHDKKIKRGKDDLVIHLKPTTDIAADFGKRKRENQFLVGFALETNDGLKNAWKKVQKKNLDMIVLNSLTDKGAGFGTDTNKITILDDEHQVMEFKLKSKNAVAEDIISEISKKMDHA